MVIYVNQLNDVLLNVWLVFICEFERNDEARLIAIIDNRNIQNVLTFDTQDF